MPVHDWTRVDAGLLRDFRQSWSVRIKNARNAGVLPKGYYALVDQRVGGPEPDVIALETGRGRQTRPDRSGSTGLADQPRTRLVWGAAADAAAYSGKADRITVRQPPGSVVAVIGIVSPGNKEGRAAVRALVEKAVEFPIAAAHRSVVDLFPPTPRDPPGVEQGDLGRVPRGAVRVARGPAARGRRLRRRPPR